MSFGEALFCECVWKCDKLELSANEAVAISGSAVKRSLTNFGAETSYSR